MESLQFPWRESKGRAMTTDLEDVSKCVKITRAENADRICEEERVAS